MTTADLGGDPTVSALLDRALAIAELPVTVLVSDRTETNLRWANNALTTNGEMRSRSLTVVATADVSGGTAVGTVSQEISTLTEVTAVVRAAERAARTGPPSQDAAPAAKSSAEDLVGSRSGDAVADAPPATPGIEVLSGVADGLEAAFGRARAEEVLLFGFAELVVTATSLASSNGLRRSGVQPTGRFELNAKSADLARSAWLGQPTRNFTDVDVAAHYDELVTRLGWAQTRIDLPPGRYETILPPGPVADLMIYAFWTANARDAEEGRNVFAAGEGKTRVGERLSPLPVRLRSDPDYPGLETLDFVDYAGSADGTSWVFDLGLPIPATTWVQDGVLTELVRNRAYAARTGRSATPPADNLLMDAGGTATLEEMVASTKRGLLLTCLWYIREVDPERLLLTGLTRDGVYLVEDGKVVGAVNNFRFNESPVELLARITEAGAAVSTLCREWNDYYNRTLMPPLRVADFTMSTVSQAS